MECKVCGEHIENNEEFCSVECYEEYEAYLETVQYDEDIKDRYYDLVGYLG